MKKILSFILAVTMLITGFVFAFAAQKGDIDGDGAIKAADARLALRASVGLESLNSKQQKAADVDGDGAIKADDARFILRLSVGLESINATDFKKADVGVTPRTDPSAFYSL